MPKSRVSARGQGDCPKQETLESHKHEFVLCQGSLPKVRALGWPDFISIVYLTNYETTPAARFGNVMKSQVWI